MRKRILSIALVLCMVLAVLPTAVIVQAATPTGTALTQDNISNYTTLTGGSTESEMVYYYLSENVKASETITVTGYVTLNLKRILPSHPLPHLSKTVLLSPAGMKRITVNSKQVRLISPTPK